MTHAKNSDAIVIFMGRISTTKMKIKQLISILKCHTFLADESALLDFISFQYPPSFPNKISKVS